MIFSISFHCGKLTCIHQLKAIVIDDKLKVCHQVNVTFDNELSEYKTKSGVHRSDDGLNRVTAPVNMWLKALDMCFEKLKIDGLDFSTVLGISGCAQQHGSVWWRRESAQLLANLNPDEYLHKELVSAFSLRDSPVWMDSSTSEECRQIETYVGGPEKLAEITGSRAYERFTGPQIAKIYKQKREVYMVTERITLISNFLASIFCGSYAPLDVCDASGMNMMDIKRKRWSEKCLEAIFGGDKKEVLGLKSRLGCLDSSMNDNIVDSHEVIGRVSKYLIERYGFPAECLISSFTGDNPASLAGLCVGTNDLIISLGTSDTAFFSLDDPKSGRNWHVLRNPIDENLYMGLICFKNGSKTRSRISDHCSKGNWDEFSRLVNSAPAGNSGNIGFYFDLREIYPLAIGDFRYNEQDQAVDSFSNEVEARACLEGQFMRLYHHSQSLGFDMKKLKRVVVTGGASANSVILQVIADVFKSPVCVLKEITNSACLGGAYLAKYAYELEQQKLDQSFKLSTRPGVEHGSQSEEKGFSDEEGTGSSDPEQKITAKAKVPASETLGFAQEKQVDFREMVLGHEENETYFVKAADPNPVVLEENVYKPLLERYVTLETLIAMNNDSTLS